MLVCLQALDAGGKDGTIRHVMSGVNPQGVRVSGFKVPSAEELDHDYLWRYARRLPGARRDRDLQPVALRGGPRRARASGEPRPPEAAERPGKDIWDRRYREINDWERYLVDNGFTVVKLFLNLSKEEQRIRFLKRIDVPERNWKFSAADARERRRWDDYQVAFSQMLSATSTEHAPWYVVPADRKWFARICAAAVLAHTLIEIDPQYPTVSEEARRDLADVKRELEAEAPEGAAPDPYAAAHNGHGHGHGERHGRTRGEADDDRPVAAASAADRSTTVQTTHAPQATTAPDARRGTRGRPPTSRRPSGSTPPSGCRRRPQRNGCARTARTRCPRSSRSPAGAGSSRSTAATCRSSWWPPRWCRC